MLKYGDFVKDVTQLFPDRSPIPGVHYISKPLKNPLKIIKKS